MMTPLPEGTSDPYDCALLESGLPLDGTGFTITIVLGADGVAIGSPGVTVAWLDQAGGTVRISGAEILPVAGYTVRFQLEDSGGQIGYVPNGDVPETWDVVPKL